jgi:pimeloyl-ACP methyl ester carboxylesterase
LPTLLAVAAGTIVLVHGGFLGPWIWDDVRAVLSRERVEAVAVDLPTVSSRGTFDDDVEVVRSAVDHTQGPVLVCGHSYGGAVITEAAGNAHSAIRRLVYLAGAMPDVGRTMADLGGATRPASRGESVRLREDGLAELDATSAIAALFNDCDAGRAAAAIQKLRPMNLAGAARPLRAAAWHDIPTTFVRGTMDAMPEMVCNDFWSTGPEVVELPTGHCPNWSRPDLVGQLLAQRALSNAA